MILRRLIAATVVLLICTLTAVAQEGTVSDGPFQAGKVGLLISPPLSGTTRIGVAYHVNDTVAVKPTLGFALERYNPDGDSSVSASQLLIGVAVDNYFDIAPAFAIYGGAALEYIRQAQDFGIGGADELKANLFSIVPRLGIQYMPAERFALYGEAGVGFAFGKEVIEFAGDDFDTGLFFMQTQAAIGAIFYFN